MTEGLVYFCEVAWDGTVFEVSFPDLSGALTYGETLEEALCNAQEALEGVLGAMVEYKLSIPGPVATEGEGRYPIAVGDHLGQLIMRKREVAS